MNHAIVTLLLVAAVTGCISRPLTPTVLPEGNGVTTQYAVLFTASDWREGEDDYVDAEGLNATWLQTARIYQSLLNSGYQQTDIAVLYLDARTPQNEPGNYRLANDFSLCNRGTASKRRLRQVLAEMASQMDADDHLAIHLSLHGKRTGRLRSDMDETITPLELTSMLKEVPAQNRLTIIDACHAEAVIRRISLPGTYIGTARAEEYGWVDRDFSFGQFFFEHSEFNDAVRSRDYMRLFTKASALYKEFGEKKRDYIRNQYTGGGLSETESAKLTFTPVIILK